MEINLNLSQWKIKISSFKRKLTDLNAKRYRNFIILRWRFFQLEF